MVKRICFTLVFLIVLSVCSISAFAAPEDNKSDSDAKAAKEKFISITKPGDGKKAITYNKTYTISGVTEEENIRIELYRFNEDKDQYEKITIEDKNYWDLEDSGITFAKEIDLKEGKNKIKLVAFKISNEEDQQINIFEIDRNKKKILDILKDKINEFLESI